MRAVNKLANGQFVTVTVSEPRRNVSFNLAMHGHPDILDRLIDWKLQDPKISRHLQEEKHMQRQFTIELRVDYADPEKNPSMQQALQAAARHVYATAVLLADGVKPQIAIFSDDFFTGHEVIALLEDTIARGVESIGGAEEGEDISSELMAAATK